MFILFPGREPKSKDQELFRKAEYITEVQEADVMQRTLSRRLPALRTLRPESQPQGLRRGQFECKRSQVTGNARALARTEDARIVFQGIPNHGLRARAPAFPVTCAIFLKMAN
jgi:hypothetical protein